MKNNRKHAQSLERHRGVPRERHEARTVRRHPVSDGRLSGRVPRAAADALPSRRAKSEITGVRAGADVRCRYKKKKRKKYRGPVSQFCDDTNSGRGRAPTYMARMENIPSR